MNLKRFEEFLELGIARRQRKDMERAKSLIREAEKKKAFLDKILITLPFEEIEPNYVIESCYDIILEIVRAKLLQSGFNAGNSHEAEVSFMRNISFSEADVNFMNELRYFRNGIKYYGKILDKEYAKKALVFLKKIYPMLTI